MAKFKHLKPFQQKYVPDHILQEIEVVIKDLSEAITPVWAKTNPNIFLSAFNRLHASLILIAIEETPENIKNAAMNEVKALLWNMEDISCVELLPKDHGS